MLEPQPLYLVAGVTKSKSIIIIWWLEPLKVLLFNGGSSHFKSIIWWLEPHYYY